MFEDEAAEFAVLLLYLTGERHICVISILNQHEWIIGFFLFVKPVFSTTHFLIPPLAWVSDFFMGSSLLLSETHCRTTYAVVVVQIVLEIPANIVLYRIYAEVFVQIVLIVEIPAKHVLSLLIWIRALSRSGGRAGDSQAGANSKKMPECFILSIVVLRSRL